MNDRMNGRPLEALVIGLVMLVVIASLSGCATTGPTNVVHVPVPVECKEPVPARPAMATESLKPGGKLFDAVVAMQAEIETREGYENQLATALKACTAPIKVTPAP